MRRRLLSERLIALSQELDLIVHDDADRDIITNTPELHCVRTGLTSLVGIAVLDERPAIDLSDVPVERPERLGIITGNVHPRKPETWPSAVSGTDVESGS